VAAADRVPSIGARTEYGNVGLAVAIEIRSLRYITGQAKRDAGETGSAAQDEPLVPAANHRFVRLVIPVVVAGNGNVTAGAETHGGKAERASVQVPGPAAAHHREVRAAVAVKVRPQPRMRRDRRAVVRVDDPDPVDVHPRATGARIGAIA